MSTMQYNLATAEALMKFAYPEYGDEDLKPYEIKEDGVYVAEAFRGYSPAETVLDWTPADEMDWPGSPDPLTAPFLPIPFDAAQLAAAMIEGPGHLIQQEMGYRIGYALDDDALSKFRARQKRMRDALVEAYALAAGAQSVVGEFDYEQEARAHEMAKRYDEENQQANEREGVFEPGITQDEANARRARAVASMADLKAQAERAQTEVAANWKAWRKSMVRELLKPKDMHFVVAQAQADALALPVVNSASRVQSKPRRDLLTPVIEAAQRECSDPFDTPSVWAALVQMAHDRRHPLDGMTEDGLKWRDAEDEVRFFSKKNLGERLRRKEKNAPQGAKTLAKAR